MRVAASAVGCGAVAVRPGVALRPVAAVADAGPGVAGITSGVPEATTPAGVPVGSVGRSAGWVATTLAGVSVGRPGLSAVRVAFTSIGVRDASLGELVGCTGRGVSAGIGVSVGSSGAATLAAEGVMAGPAGVGRAEGDGTSKMGAGRIRTAVAEPLASGAGDSTLSGQGGVHAPSVRARLVTTATSSGERPPATRSNPVAHLHVPCRAFGCSRARSPTGRHSARWCAADDSAPRGNGLQLPFYYQWAVRPKSCRRHLESGSSAPAGVAHRVPGDRRLRRDPAASKHHTRLPCVKAAYCISIRAVLR